MSGATLTRWRSRVRLPLLVLFAANVALLVVYTLPRMLQERNLAQQAAALRQRLEAERNSLAAQTARADTIRQNARDVEAFYRDVLPDLGDKVKAFLELDRDAPSVANHSYRPGPVKGVPVTQIAVTMPLSGSYDRLVAFLRKLETGERFVTVDRVSLQEKEQGAVLDIEVSLYFRTPPESKG